MSRITLGNAISFHAFSDVLLRDDEARIKATDILRGLRNGALNCVANVDKHFVGRIIPLNKVHP